jgi:hypothetical protein
MLCPYHVVYLTENSCKKTNSDPEKILAGNGLKKAESRWSPNADRF